MADALIVIAGSSGLIGSALVTALRASDNRVVRIVRRAPSNSDELHWNPQTGEFDPDALRGVDAVVNLCGAGVGDKRWSGAYKQRLRDSRIAPTEVISAAVVEAGVQVLINASAVGYYGNTGDRVVDETAPAGTGFLAQLCEDWEAATLPAQQAGVRVVLARTGLVLSPAVVCSAVFARCSRWDSAPDSATAASTCRGSALKTRCARCCSRSHTMCPVL